MSVLGFHVILHNSMPLLKLSYSETGSKFDSNFTIYFSIFFLKKSNHPLSHTFLAICPSICLIHLFSTTIALSEPGFPWTLYPHRIHTFVRNNCSAPCAEVWKVTPQLVATQEFISKKKVDNKTQGQKSCVLLDVQKKIFICNMFHFHFVPCVASAFGFTMS